MGWIITLCIFLYLIVGVLFWAFLNWLTEGAWDSIGWSIVFSVFFVILFPVEIIVAFYGTLYWLFTYRRRTYTWIEYMKKVLGWEA